MRLAHKIRTKAILLQRQVLRRIVPHTVVTWRFLLPNQPLGVRLHRLVFLQAWPQLPRPLWLLITLYSLTLWYGFFAWYHSGRCWRRHRREQIGCSPCRQLMDLLHLTLLHGIPPWFYYHYRLFDYPSRQWLDFVYTHELPHWHQLLSLGKAGKSSGLLGDKRRFAEVLAAHGLPTVPTQHYLEKGETLDEPALFSRRDWFIKPNHGHGSFGCLVLRYAAATQAYGLNDFLSGEVFARGEAAILAHLASRLQMESLLVQPCQHNHPDIESLFGRRKLITVRLICGRIDTRYQPLAAVLEVPLLDKPHHYLMIQIDVESGRLLPPAPGTMPLLQRNNLEIQAILKQLHQAGMPQWSVIRNLCCQAHAFFHDLRTAGWDVILTPEGVKMVEGNVNWGVAVHQLHPSGPLLQGALIRVYQPHMSKVR